MKIWVDADAAPRDVKEIIYRAAQRLQIETILVANRRLSTPLNNPFVSTVWVQGGPDVADRHIADHASIGDVTITADIPLAARTLEKGALVVGPTGRIVTIETIGAALGMRELNRHLRETGESKGYNAAFGPRDRSSFLQALDRLVRQAMR